MSKLSDLLSASKTPLVLENFLPRVVKAVAGDIKQSDMLAP